MNCVISIINPNGQRIMADICKRLDIPVTLELYGRGTATKSMLDLIGLESREKRIIMTVAGKEQTAALIKEQKRRLYIDAPGNGIVISTPVKSVGGASTLAYLNSGNQAKKRAPELDYGFELILAIANGGCTDAVMDAARAAGATGGTVLHAKGTGAANAEKFFKVSIAQEKEIVLIVAKSSAKTEIMASILEKAGPDSESGAILLSLPVTEVAGFGMDED